MDKSLLDTRHRLRCIHVLSLRFSIFFVSKIIVVNHLVYT